MFNKKLINYFSEIENIINSTGGYVEGNLICHTAANNITIERNKDKIINLQKAVSNKSTVCEIGVNAGHSLLIMLDVNPYASYQLFDIGSHPYTRECVTFIQNEFKSTNIDIIYGDSLITLPIFSESNKEKFDLIHVDGGHQTDVVSSDYSYSLKMISREGVIIFDDYNLKNIRKFLNQRLGKEIIEIVDNYYIKNEYHIIYKKK